MLHPVAVLAAVIAFLSRASPSRAVPRGPGSADIAELTPPDAGLPHSGLVAEVSFAFLLTLTAVVPVVAAPLHAVFPAPGPAPSVVAI